jgi:rubrerythrin
MSEKPSYLGLLNAISLAECEANAVLDAWAGVTPSDDVRAVLLKVSAREREHAATFAKRINELGYQLRPKDDPKLADRLAFAASGRTDLEKMEKLGFGTLDTGDEPDVFDGFFKNHSIDIRTGELLGRYICEERDTARLLRSCYQQLQGAAAPGAAADRLAALEAKVDALVEALAPTANGNGKPKARKVSA